VECIQRARKAPRPTKPSKFGGEIYSFSILLEEAIQTFEELVSEGLIEEKQSPIDGGQAASSAQVYCRRTHEGGEFAQHILDQLKMNNFFHVSSLHAQGQQVVGEREFLVLAVQSTDEWKSVVSLNEVTSFSVARIGRLSKQLEAEGFLERQVQKSVPLSKQYRLSEKGRKLRKILKETEKEFFPEKGSEFSYDAEGIAP
jgi:DNA-binding MarR family transcriptional regulator